MPCIEIKVCHFEDVLFIRKSVRMSVYSCSSVFHMRSWKISALRISYSGVVVATTICGPVSGPILGPVWALFRAMFRALFRVLFVALFGAYLGPV